MFFVNSLVSSAPLHLQILCTSVLFHSLPEVFWLLPTGAVLLINPEEGPSSWNQLALELQRLTSHYVDNRQRDLERIRNFLLFNLLHTTCETDGGKFFKGLSLKW